MLINADFSVPAIVDSGAHRWVASPQAGVSRMMLDRVGGERARATSIVRYVPNSAFPRHAHPGGEEIFVLAGVFSDDTGDYPAGWYLRNPPGSSHAPSSRDGATIFVKLQQMDPADKATVRIDTREASNWHAEPERRVCHLYARGCEHVAMHAVAGGHAILPHWRGCAELLVIDGAVRLGVTRYETGSWLRLPANDPLTLLSDEGTTVLVKTGAFPGAGDAGVARLLNMKNRKCPLENHS
jgi:anti-sigma factor ChrR (cupin superfamily)